MTEEIPDAPAPKSADRAALRRWTSAVRKAEADLHRAIRRRHSEDYFEAIRAKVDRLEEIDRELRLPSVPRTEINVPFWDRVLISLEQYGEPIALAAFIVIFIAGVLIGAVI